MSAPNLRPFSPGDEEALARVYNHYVAHTVVTFEETPIAAATMRARIDEVLDADLPWLVVEADGQPCGYAYASRWKGRCAYRFSVETTVYLAPEATGRGLGTALYAELLERVGAGGAHVAIGGIALPNDASVALHEKLGMRRVALFSEVGFKQGRWVDVGYWQKTFAAPAR
ncbi:MAG: N-acetyltransferase family protein [Planctomycetota bacterium]